MRQNYSNPGNVTEKIKSTGVGGKSGHGKDYFETQHLKDGLKNKAIKGGTVTVIARAIDYILHTVGTVFLARLLSPEDFGLVAMVVTITSVFVVFKDLGLSEATIQSEKLNHAQVSTLFWLNVVLGTSILLIMALLAPAIAWFYGNQSLVSITIVSSLSFLFASLATQHLALLKRSMGFNKIAVIEIVASLGSIALAVILAYRGFGYWALVTRPVFLSFFNAFGLWVICGWRPGLPVKGAGVRSLVKFGANTSGFYLINYFARNVDKILVGRFIGAQVLGFYQKAYFLFVLPVNQLTIPLQGVGVSTLTKLRNDPSKFKRFFIRALGLLAFVGMPMSAFIASVGDIIIVLLLGPQWAEAAEIFAVFSLGAGMQIIYATQGWLHVSLGRSDRWLRWGIIGSGCMVVSFFIGLPFGATGIAAAYTICLYIVTFPAIWYAGRPVLLSAKEIIAGIWKYYIASVIAGILAYAVSQSTVNYNSLVRLSIVTVQFTSTYLVIVVILHGSLGPIKEFSTLLFQSLPLKKKKVSNKFA
ncbi:lipopolysaccharide biosynthesis protein [Chitinispirillales bacterium ANBcel5]|uniref:lipopolysaccharide biosynthesis protein n=1 Tax=Cellulosispirillum alkaliphilum TaxID=3039283 RepID=UPI002A5591A3|nr:lipopolysaccharide biosynthesis protein [Chitinispirillales bacterium ANBcel5]